ncbi:hypothetical protein Vretimale_1700 [Volvox reticuliferus]|uniref:Rad60/SUMO-like domain-containing protein n=1 Tax=Volvox reticuliferus TaxID=1737510 RepID=A0A8J4G2A5_9CHLO|nr:hypothetical protein Vretifemale_15500 [Volvox reticuliferus]GIL95745.1 hypothetical protein Vretimale_1700 [Volvox reticuliferus]
MSDLWDYDDDDDQDNRATWGVPSPDRVVAQVNGSCRKRKSRKPVNASKRRAVLPAANLEVRPIQLHTTILLDATDDDDDLVLMTSPIVKGDEVDLEVTSMAGPRNPAPRTAPVASSAVANLNSATQESLAKEQELLHALQQVTKWESQLDAGNEPCPLPSVSRLPGLGLSHLTSRWPLAGNAHRTADAVDVDLRDEEEVVANDRNLQEPTGSGQDIARTSSTAGKEQTAEERVQLKLIWGRDKDECIKMRVVKTDPFERMITKFREIAKQRSLCSDPNKIKFLFDGDDLAKMSTETPNSLDMEDDMIIDVKL